MTEHKSYPTINTELSGEGQSGLNLRSTCRINANVKPKKNGLNKDGSGFNKSTARQKLEKEIPLKELKINFSLCIKVIL